jgi:dCTP deaminase
LTKFIVPVFILFIVLLSDQAIVLALKNKEIVFENKIEENDIRMAGIRVYLGDKIIVSKSNQTIDFRSKNKYEIEEFSLKKEDFILKPKQFILGSINCSFKLSRNLISFLDGRSTLARCGLQIHNSCFLLDGHYNAFGSVTLEMFNNGENNIILYDQMPIGQIMFIRVEGSVKQNQAKQYLGQRGATAPNFIDNVI